jgi:hypothetical protein
MHIKRTQNIVEGFVSGKYAHKYALALNIDAFLFAVGGID